MQNLLRRTTRRQKQYQFVSCVLIAAVLVGGIYDWWNSIRLRTIPITSNVVTIDLRQEIIDSLQTSVSGMYGLGAMGNSETKLETKNIDVTEKLSFELWLENDDVYSTVLNDRIMTMNNVRDEIRTEIEEYEYEEKMKEIENIICDTSDITKISNMTEEQIDEMLEGTWLEGNAEVIYKVEQEESINAFFIYAVATLESDRGTSKRSITKKNFYGIELSTVFTSYSHNTEYFGGMMNRVYVSNGKISLDTINPTYCPPNPNWKNVVAQLMYEQYNKMTVETVA